MPKPAKFSYTKKEPFRDASYFIVVCEGESREPSYFRFFEGISSRVKIYPVSSGGTGAPEKLIEIAQKAADQLDIDETADQLWFVVDTDRWRMQLRNLRSHCDTMNAGLLHKVIRASKFGYIIILKEHRRTRRLTLVKNGSLEYRK